MDIENLLWNSVENVFHTPDVSEIKKQSTLGKIFSFLKLKFK